MVTHNSKSDLPRIIPNFTIFFIIFPRVFSQDYVNIAGLRIWQEELSRIFNFYVEQESNLYLKQKVLPEASVYQSKTIAIPMLGSNGAGSSDFQTFMGRLMHEIICLTSFKTTLFVPARQAWYDFKTQGKPASRWSLCWKIPCRYRQQIREPYRKLSKAH